MSANHKQSLKEEIKYAKHLHQIGERKKFHQSVGGRYINDLVYGANDGIITTFAVVSGVAGAALPLKTVLILGLANLIADGISMGASSFLGSKSQRDYYQRERAKEAWEVQHIPEEEKQEIREIYKRKGFAGKDLDRAVEIITGKTEQWIDDMMRDELGLINEPEGQAWKNGLATFVAFVVAGFMPLLSYFFLAQYGDPFVLSTVITCVTLFIVGALRTLVIKRVWWQAGFEMLVIGMLAAGVAYGIGALLQAII